MPTVGWSGLPATAAASGSERVWTRCSTALISAPTIFERLSAARASPSPKAARASCGSDHKTELGVATSPGMLSLLSGSGHGARERAGAARKGELLDQAGDVENRGDPPVGEDRRPGDAVDLPGRQAERLDDDLLLADQPVDDQADLAGAVLDHDREEPAGR